MTQKRQRGGPASKSPEDHAPEPPPFVPPPFEPPPFEPVDTRARHDGWSPERQGGFIEALGECGCVDEASKRVGMSVRSAYALRRRVDAQSFRQAWDFALDYAIRRLSDGAFSRAINGVSRPVFYKGEQIGERRHYDERLTMFLLRYRDPLRYGAWLDDMRYQRHPDGAAIALAKMINRVEDDADAEQAGAPRPIHPPLYATDLVSDRVASMAQERADTARIALEEAHDAAIHDAAMTARWNAHLANEAQAAKARSQAPSSDQASSAEAPSDKNVPIRTFR
ncbi:hypothetical protein [Sphingomonas sp. OK281]|uniref:hypothetical protein n=1 Tax=Sphingomonas sp. OK281 TaxID=1881067 RepID=UPI0008E31DCF|nr:hypothetical protein [Sphingomonas sp. OK281]SFN99338.1 hypothetical protein SAMN05428984_1485 [Sphingomonas sp. OK281]